MLLADLVATSAAVAGTRSRLAKVAALADLLAALAPGEIRPAVGFLIGDPSQGRVGIGWATLRDLDAGAAPDPTLTVADIDALIDGVRAATGSGLGSRAAAHPHGRIRPCDRSRGRLPPPALAGRTQAGRARRGS